MWPVRITQTLPALMTGFFQGWLVGQCNASYHTVCAYRDAWRQLLQFLAQRRGKPVAALDLPDITAAEVIAFLRALEEERRVSIRTRNCRLAAIRSFFSFVASHEPAAAAQCAAILGIPLKRGPRAALSYLDVDEVKAIIDQPDRETLAGQRDHALLALLYSTGGRIQEILALRPRDVRFERPPQVRLYGKGRKERTCPLMPEMATLLSELLRRDPRETDEPIFRNRFGQPLGASGVRFVLRRYVRAAAGQVHGLAGKHVTPHTFRHTCAVHLVASGVDSTVIQGWLGHASLDTTNHYAQADVETKRRALELLPAVPKRKAPRWRRDESLLGWLESL
jgi:site-specific recombinase XerD